MKQNEILTNILSGNTELIKTYVSMFDRYNSKCKILVTPEHIKKVLIDYLDKKMCSQELSIWADFLCCNDGFFTPYHENEDYYENMWYVVQRISTPFIDGEINIENISKYLAELIFEYKL